MEQEQQGKGGPPPERAIVYGRYTSHDGFKGWIQARNAASPFYGDGAIELRGQDFLVRGWHRNWLGVPERVERVIPLNDISDVMADGRTVRFVWLRAAGRSRQMQFQAETNDEAAALSSWLPKVRSDRFERWAALSALNDRVEAIGTQPWLTAGLVALNIVLFIAWVSTGLISGPLEQVELQALGSNYGPAVLTGEWWRLFTSLFLHTSIPHVLVNMWVLWNVGRLCERLYGNVSFALLYLGSGLLACLTRIAWDPTIASIGASGAIFGVIGAFLAFALRSHQQILVTVPRSTWVSTAVFTAYSLISGWFNPAVDNAAHAGGLIGGAILGWIMTRPLDVEVRESPPLQRYAASVALLICVSAAVAWHARTVGPVTAIERFFHDHNWYVGGEARNLQAWADLQARRGAGRLGNAELATGFERQVLPFWDDVAKRLKAGERTLPADQRTVNALLMKVAGLRQKWAHAIISGARDPSTEDKDALTKLNSDIDQTVARLERLSILARVSHREGSLAHSSLVYSVRSLLSSGVAPCVESPTAFARMPGPGERASDGPHATHAVGCRAQSLFLAGHYRELDELINTAAHSVGDLPDGASTLDGIFEGLGHLFEFDSHDFLAHLGRTADWRHELPSSVNPALVESELFEASAWVARGHGMGDTVSPQAWKLYAYELEMARASLDDIQGSAKTNPQWYAMAINNGLDRSRPAAELRDIFDRGAAIAPAYGPLYRAMLRALMPRWGGSHEEVASFIDAVTDRPIEPDFILYARLHWLYSSLEEDEVSLFKEQLAHWSVMETGFERLIERYPKSDFILNAFAKFACIANDEGKYIELRPKLTGHFSSMAWSDAVSLKSCDARFQPST